MRLFLNSLKEMVARIKTIKEKADESEKMVMDITRDIKNLDQGKRNLTLSITVLRRLQMLGNSFLAEYSHD
jgi:hypothetical protein